MIVESPNTLIAADAELDTKQPVAMVTFSISISNETETDNHVDNILLAGLLVKMGSVYRYNCVPSVKIPAMLDLNRYPA